jgi:hypothetical protein
MIAPLTKFIDWPVLQTVEVIGCLGQMSPDLRQSGNKAKPLIPYGGNEQALCGYPIR